MGISLPCSFCAPFPEVVRVSAGKHFEREGYDKTCLCAKLMISIGYILVI